MADINAVDEDQKLISKIVEQKKKSDPEGLLRAQKESRLVEYLAEDLANVKRKNKKGFTRLKVKSLSYSPKLAVRGYTKLENKEDSTSSNHTKAAQAKTSLRGLSTKSRPTASGLACQPARGQVTKLPPASETTPCLSAISRKTSTVRVLDYKTTGVLNSLKIEKHHKPITKRKQKKKALDSPILRLWNSAPELSKTSSTQTSRTIEKRNKPMRKSAESVRPKMSYLTIVPEKPRSRSDDVDRVKPSTKQIERQNTPKPIRRNYYGKHGYKPIIARSKSYSPKYEMKTNCSLEEIILEQAAMFKSVGKSDVPKLLNIKRKTIQLVKKTPGGNIFNLKKKTVAPRKCNPK